ncbi:hypothetical protein CFC21_105378 [Triticum aestivum]|uniref:NB-ARC domain-containing protein n=2 Tax=Triticum aestivum TaxID=4565 RepID=A0A3B6SSD7_WHEAT|nr:hypothetical protein CFC21_105378 [Triticum aestivum]
MGALWWSYQYLDEQVRRCFAYCSIFPRRHKLRRDELVKLWMAEGFIKTSKPEEEMEDVAKKYFDELLSASFLQLGGKEYDHLHEREIYYFTIHDLLCDLAEEVAGRDCFRIEKDFTGEVPLGVRYLFVGTCNMEMLTEKIYGLQNLRTLIIDGRIDVESDKHKAFKRMFAMFTRLPKLRVLKLCAMPYNDAFSFPESIGDLKHLRYFAFCVWGIVKLTLPGTFTKLYHMQANLEFANIGRLIFLQTLPFFRIKRERGYEPHHLKHLNKLQGELAIHGLENIESKEEAVEVNLIGKEKLTRLILSWEDGSCSPEVQAEVLENFTIFNCSWDGLSGKMEHLTTLKILSISYCENMRLPPTLPKSLKVFSIADCSLKNALPGNIEHLTSLKKLEINSCKNMRSLPTLPKSLEEITVKYCSDEFTQSCVTTDDPNWQKIEHIPKKTITFCS